MCPAVTVTKLNCMPANMAKINFDTQEWSRIFFGDGTLEWHQKPKEIKE